jgi:hypothetical protein
MEHPFFDDAIDMHEAAEMLGYAAIYFRGAYKDIGVPFDRFCGRIIFRRSTLEEWMEKNTRRGRLAATVAANAAAIDQQQRQAYTK